MWSAWLVFWNSNLSSLCWRRITVLWKLPDGRDWLRGKLGPILMSEAKFRKNQVLSTEKGKKSATCNLFPPISWGPHTKAVNTLRFSRQEYWSGLPFPSPVDHVLSELSTMTHPSWVALHGMAHSFIELDKAVVHVISLAGFLWLWFSFRLPSDEWG